ncbi:MAG: hypothetical protein ACREXR_00630 [Gammaproteobacteria bacterium]
MGRPRKGKWKDAYQEAYYFARKQRAQARMLESAVPYMDAELTELVKRALKWKTGPPLL